MSGLSALDQNRLLLVGDGAALSRDGGETFDRASGKIARARLNAADVAPGAVFAYGPGAIFKSTDQGAHWKAVKTPKRRAVADLDFVGRNIGYLLDTRGVLWKTTNGGSLWNQLPVGQLGFGVAFSNLLDGYVAVGSFGTTGGGLVMKTSDGGRSWHPQLVSRDQITALASGGTGRLRARGRQLALRDDRRRRHRLGLDAVDQRPPASAEAAGPRARLRTALTGRRRRGDRRLDLPGGPLDPQAGDRGVERDVRHPLADPLESGLRGPGPR